MTTHVVDKRMEIEQHLLIVRSQHCVQRLQVVQEGWHTVPASQLDLKCCAARCKGCQLGQALLTAASHAY